MKKITNLILVGSFAFFALTACSSDDSSDLGEGKEIEKEVEKEIEKEIEKEVEKSLCTAPTNLTKEVINNSFSSDALVLNWVAGGDESEWKVIYKDFFGTNEFIVSENTLTIDSFVEDHIITITSICDADTESETVTFSKIDSSDIDVVANMTATVNGVSYSNLIPRPFFVLAPDHVSPGFINADDIWLQGASEFNSGFEINLFIDESDWKVGSYELKGGDSDDLDMDLDTHVTFFNLNNDNLYYIEKPGSIEITKFDSDERIIEGTFSFSYNVYDRSTFNLISTEVVENGTFKYTLNEEYFN